MFKLNLGCGHDKLEGYKNIDIQDLPSVDESYNFICRN